MNALASRTRSRMRAALVSLVVGVGLLVAKFVAWHITGSQIVFSDAMESIVNVVASCAALAAVWLASQPADANHPYGHGKVEFITGGFEGGLIAFAAIVIVYKAVEALILGGAPTRLGVGMAIVAAAGVANLLLGLYLVHTGRSQHSPALVADGQHVISDFWTSAGALVGLALVQWTGLRWIDPAAAIVVALFLLRTGAGLVREAARGLMDEFDPATVDGLAGALESAREPGVIEVHELRAIDVGGYRHVDCHVVVPEFWTVDRAHDTMDAYERRVVDAVPYPGEFQFHVDPCERAYCASCDLEACPVRVAAFLGRRPFDLKRVTSGPSPAS